ncbi:hypothetical protein [Caballeronia sp. GAFFF2]|uniref:hypothetical protein n=1 Tax=Caballeronia sp. GAFFF2 TaxID=2921741 RepID=UPI002028CA1F|nr:hypothetical protein [Caballeronia sp. GAFFF2]
MPIVRGPQPDRNFTRISNRILNDAGLSWAARGMLVHLLSKPDHWAINVQALINETRDAQRPAGRDAVYKILDELTSARYVRQKRNSTGSVVWTVFDEPYPENPDEGLEICEKPYPEKPDEEARKGVADHGEPHPEKPDLEKPDRDIPDVLVKTEEAVKTEKPAKGDSLREPSTTASIASHRQKSSALPCPVDAIVKAYHDLLPDNPRVKVVSDARRKMISARWKEASQLTCKPFGYADVPSGIAAWRRFFQVCSQSLFLTGKATPSPGRTPFVADIDFLMKPSSFISCLENKYHRDAA